MHSNKIEQNAIFCGLISYKLDKISICCTLRLDKHKIRMYDLCDMC